MADLEGQDVRGATPAPPKDEPVCLKVEQQATTRTDSEVHPTILCLPTKRGTLFCSVVSGAFVLLGLLAFSAAELEIPNAKATSILLWRFVGSCLIFYIPIVMIAATMDKKYMFWRLQPFASINSAYLDMSEPTLWLKVKRALLLSLEHILILCLWALLVFVQFDGKNLGLIPIFAGLCVLRAPLARFFLGKFGPPPVSVSYAVWTYPWIGYLPCLVVMLLAAGYLPLRQVGGIWTGVFMPLLLSSYEFLGTVLLTKKFTKRFLTQAAVRDAYAGTNQGIMVSMGICSLHAQAEACRFVLLYMEYTENPGLSILIPIISGVVWNVLTRIGLMDRCLYLVTCGRWKPNNSSKLLRASGYCMGYPRFGALIALFLAKLFVGSATIDTLVQAALIAFAAEAVENLVSYAMWRAKVNLCPAAHYATDQEVEAKTLEVVVHRKTSSSVVPVDPAMQPRTWTPLPTVRWKVREAYDFKYGPQEFGRLPVWAHLTPTMLAQFQTILAMAIFSGGFNHVLGLCESGFSDSEAWLWPLGHKHT